MIIVARSVPWTGQATVPRVTYAPRAARMAWMAAS
jgi:hypothetical protein